LKIAGEMATGGYEDDHPLVSQFQQLTVRSSGMLRA